MRIHLLELENLKGRPKELQFTFDFPELVKENPQIVESSSISFSGEANNSAGLFEVEGEITLTIVMTCSRCLSPVKEDLHVPFKEFFAYERTRPQEETEEHQEIQYVKEDSVDLLPYCKEAIILALPYVPLCDPDCKGLCPICGVNQNDGQCGCTVERIDPRLADLAKFFNQNNE